MGSGGRGRGGAALGLKRRELCKEIMTRAGDGGGGGVEQIDQKMSGVISLGRRDEKGGGNGMRVGGKKVKKIGAIDERTHFKLKQNASIE